uniref:FERM domain-containing protein 3-like n=1 Tax=Saccoglossus kowalevskii TaxID=10224 RepID=A0ABM0MBY9_SACKO|nr:PREDICTED: FERM domain-containing protein 3-like [Saccoglossus kowalevskii]
MLSKVKSLGREKRMMKLMEEETRCTTIGLLDDGDPIICDFNKDSKGQFLMDRVCNMLNILERDYFGLRFIDGEKQMHWLDPCKLISRQLKGGPPFNLVFRVKFYPADIGNLKEELTRYLLFLQLKRDLLHGRLLCSKEDMAMLGAYIVQAAIGNHDPLVHLHGYASEFYFGPGQSERVENRVEQLHHTMTKGQSPSEAEENFLRKARTLETYGVDPHSVKDIYGSQLHLGFTHEGLSVFQGSKRIQLFRWHDIGKFGYEGKTFFIHAMVNQRKLTHAYKSATTSASKHIWKCGLEHQAFFKFRRSSEITMQTSGGMLFKTTKFKFRYKSR